MAKTPGKVHQSPGNMRLTSQPGLKDGYVWRSSGVDRKSEKVMAQNSVFAEKMAGNKIATECKGKPRQAFFSCLRQKGKAAYK